ncbi:MAG: heavy metal translocating P-type ATPase [Pedobacter sp.]|nr:heavy metal translocating P-type ATPase [Pedobacter sp.]MDQ8052982.1 heavy metal translocating P-type ATPase [Pedobacter sp.]
MKDCCAHHSPQQVEKTHHHTENGHGHDHAHGDSNGSWKQHLGLLCGLLILATLLTLEYGFGFTFSKWYELSISILAYLLAGWEVLKLACRKILRGDIFNEFVLMSVATLGAFYIGEYAEGVAVMVFYSIGEWFQDAAVSRAKASIKALLDIRPDKVTVLKDGRTEATAAAAVNLGDHILVKAGEKVGLDGELLTESGSFNAAALTGESRPDTKHQGETIFAGMINLNKVVEIKVAALFKDSKLSKILKLVQDASARKSQTQLFISRFAKIYTPIVFFLALALALLPYFFIDKYVFNDWLYRALVFLVISCPCALVVSIPLGYYGGIGLASKNGILFKGGNFLDVMTKIDTVVMDKTGTLTKGVFKVQKIVPQGITEEELLGYAVALEKNSTHPIAQAIVAHAGKMASTPQATAVEEIPGHGMKGTVGGLPVLAGNVKLLQQHQVDFPKEIESVIDTRVVVAVGKKYVGYLTIADELKADAEETIKRLHDMNIRTVMLSGDKQAVVEQAAEQLKIGAAYGDLLPEGKVEKVEEIIQEGRHIAFVGDGVNDAPVIALADAGIAMGGLGSDAAIETADVIIQNDQIGKLVAAIKIGKLTRHIVWQNIILAMAIKIAVLSFGAFGVANLWEAVIADVGVALLAILNAVRIQKKNIQA